MSISSVFLLLYNIGRATERAGTPSPHCGTLRLFAATFHEHFRQFYKPMSKQVITIWSKTANFLSRNFSAPGGLGPEASNPARNPPWTKSPR